MAVIYFRPSLCNEDELNAARKYFTCYDSRMKIQSGDLVVARYSALPYYKETAEDIEYIGAKLINSYKQHNYIADLWNWYEDLKEFTPKTWRRLEDIPSSEVGPFIVKGETNSKKFLFDTHMYAETKLDAVDVMCRLQDDGMICDQSIYIRKYVKLKKFITGFHNLPITNEFRFFICDEQIISGAYYWSNYYDDLEVKPNIEEVPKDFLNYIIAKIGNKARFYVIDIAETDIGDWVLIELNDGQMSGLSMNDPEVLYSNLSKVLGNQSC